MIKSLLVLMLAVTQLLAGSGGSLYVCISNDGSCWCVEIDPASCTCCRQELETTEGSGCCCSHASGSCDPCNDVHGTPGGELLKFADQPCDCTFILISHPQQSAISLRVSSRTDGEHLFELPALVQHLFLHDQFVGDGPDLTLKYSPPPIPSQLLGVLSSVILRC
jgi:hypothetical protein